MEKSRIPLLILFVALLWGWAFSNVQQRAKFAAQQAAENPAGAIEGATPDAPARTPEDIPKTQLNAPTGLELPDTPSRVDSETVDYKTPHFRVEFSTVGAVPILWDITDTRYVTQLSETGLPLDNFTSPVEHLIDPRIVRFDVLTLPFQTILKENNGRYFNEFNSMIYAVEPLQNGLRFRSPQSESGLVMVKTYTFPKPESFISRLEIRLENHGDSDISFNAGDSGLGLTMGPGLGGVPDTDHMPPIMRFAKTDPIIQTELGFEFAHLKFNQEPEYFSGDRIDWGGIQSMYFLSTLHPDAANPLTSARMWIDSDVKGNLIYNEKAAMHYPSIELFTAPFKVNSGEAIVFGYDLFMGPKQRDLLKATDLGLERVLFHDSWGWVRALCLLLMKLLNWFHAVVGNWGVSIIMLTVTVRLLSFPLVNKGMKHQARFTEQQKKLQPLLVKINERFKDDPQRKQQETFKLYREHGVNPLGMFKGCAFMMIQLPIFICLYKLLYQSIDLRGAEFLWISDLSQSDKLILLPYTLPVISNEFNILPLVVAATQMISSKITMTPPADPQQAQMQKMMLYVMPFMILFFTYRFPAGLMVYWLVSNIWQFLQQLYVNKHIRGPEQAKAAAA